MEIDLERPKDVSCKDHAVHLTDVKRDVVSRAIQHAFNSNNQCNIGVADPLVGPECDLEKLPLLLPGLLPSPLGP